MEISFPLLSSRSSEAAPQILPPHDSETGSLSTPTSQSFFKSTVRTFQHASHVPHPLSAATPPTSLSPPSHRHLHTHTHTPAMLTFVSAATLSTSKAFVRPLRCPRAAPSAHISMSLDPHAAHTAVSHLLAAAPADALHSLSTLLADATAALDAAVPEAAVEAVKQPGLWDRFVATIETAITLIHNQLTSAGVPGAYGLSIVLFTLIVKAFTFPLNYRQMESTMKMQAIAPKLKQVQADYKDNPTVMQQMTADLYKKQNVNPLAGCFPVFVQIPVWVALYRSVLNLASENRLNEPFLWLPSLQGPVAQTGQGLDTWLFPLVNGQPPIGWHDALCYLTLPVILMINQYYSTKLVTPPATDPQTQQANNFLKFMPLLIGFFSLNVPSGLGVYWVTNNFLSTAQTLFIKSRFPEGSFNINASDVDDASSATIDATVSEGFSSNSTNPDDAAPGTKALKSPKNKKRRKRR